MFKKRESVFEVEEGKFLSPKFDKDGVQKEIELRIDDDQDALWMSVDIGNGASCHVGYKSCFYRSIPLGKIENSEEIKLEFKEKEKKFDPEKVYKGQPNPTKL